MFQREKKPQLCLVLGWVKLCEFSSHAEISKVKSQSLEYVAQFLKGARYF